MEKSGLLDYSMELALLVQLFQKKLVTKEEYQLIKKQLMKEYYIVSDITAIGA